VHCYSARANLLRDEDYDGDYAHATKDGGHFHAVRFYSDSDSLAKLVAEFVAEGFAAGLPAIIISTRNS
jgi:hypothetical protein